MKKLLCIVLVLSLALLLPACKKTPAEVTDPAESTTGAPAVDEGLSVDEMSPPRNDAQPQRVFPMTYAGIDRSGFEEIKKEDALTDKFDAAHIYRDGDTEYYELSDGKVFGIFTLGDDYGSVYYDENGALVYYGADPYGWFYKDGAADYLTYVCTLANGNTILTFYEPDGSRFAVFANNEYYNANLDLLTEEEQVALVKRVTYALAVLG